MVDKTKESKHIGTNGPRGVSFDFLGDINRRTLFDKHAIAVGIETVKLGNGVFVGVQDVFSSGESTDQH